MKLFIKKVLTFLFPIILICILMEILLLHIPNDYTFKKDNLKNKINSIEILILGSSHAVYDVDPVYFNYNAYNLANISQTLDFDFKLLNKYGSQMNNLKVVILPISYFSLFSRLDKGVEYWRVKNYSLYYNIYTGMNINNYFELLNGNVQDNLYRIYTYYIKNQYIITVTQLGFGNNFKSSVKNNLQESGTVAAKRHTHDLTYLEYNKTELNKIIKYCRDRKIKIVLFTPPAYYSYREKLNKEQLNILFKTITNILDNQFIYYLNYLYDDSFVEEDFYDADHLNEIGARKLTMKLNYVIKKIYSNQPPLHVYSLRRKKGRD